MAEIRKFQQKLKNPKQKVSVSPKRLLATCGYICEHQFTWIMLTEKAITREPGDGQEVNQLSSREPTLPFYLLSLFSGELSIWR